jgi:HAE1 family hydrophobic/amphiphilic exporter-1
MSLVQFSLRRRVTVAMAGVAVVVFGVVAFRRLPVNLLPDISYPSLTVETRLPGAAPQEVEALVSRPVEEVVGVVSGVRRLVSLSRPGLSQVTLEFAWGRNMDFAALDVREKLDLVTLPREASRPVVLRLDPANEPVLRLYVSGDGSLVRLRYVAEELLKKDLESADGVAAIKVNGGHEEEIHVRVDEGKLARVGIGIDEVGRRLLQENISQAGGSLYEREARYLVRSRNEFRDLDDILETVLLTRDGRSVTLGDVARVERSHRQRETITRLGGREAVELAVYKEGDANTVGVVRSVQERLEAVRRELPPGIEVVTGFDQSRFIRASIREVIENALIGGLLAVAVLLLFLKDLASTVIIAVSIPVSIVATFFLMYRTGTTLNIMSLGGLALGVGMLVDDAIVVLESIFKRREAGDAGAAAVERGAGEVSRAVVASTLTTVAVFVPVVFVEGIAAQIFRDQALTVSFSLLASLAVSLTLAPMLYALAAEAGARGGAAVAPQAGGRRRIRAALAVAPARALRAAREGMEAAAGGAARLLRPLARVFDAALAAVTAAYPPALRWALHCRAVVLAAALLLFVASVLLVPRLGVDLIPSFAEGEFAFLIEMAPGTPLETVDAYVREVQSVLDGDGRVELHSSIAGGAGMSLTRTGAEGENVARIQVRMKPGTRRRDEQEVASLLRRRLEADGRARFKFERPSYFSLRPPIEVEVYGDELPDLQQAAETVRAALAGLPGLVDVKSSLAAGSPELQVTFHREALSRLGLDLHQVASTVRHKVQGEVATRFQEGEREIDIRVRSFEAGRASVAEVNDLIVAQRDGVPIRLKSVAEVRPAEGPAEVRRLGQRRAAVVSAGLQGRDIGAAAADIQGALERVALPEGVSARLGGQSEEMQRSFRSLALALGLAIFLVYLVMACEFESLVHPLVVMFTVPLGIVGAVLSLAVSGRSIDLVAMIGAVMLAGIVVKNAIVLIDAVNRLRRGGASRDEALLQAGLSRMRPILMTTATTVLGLLPMALGIGEGAELRAPLAITVIGGLSAATALTLIVIPVVYTLFDRRSEASAAARAGAAAAPALGAGSFPA